MVWCCCCYCGFPFFKTFFGSISFVYYFYIFVSRNYYSLLLGRLHRLKGQAQQLQIKYQKALCRVVLHAGAVMFSSFLATSIRLIHVGCFHTSKDKTLPGVCSSGVHRISQRSMRWQQTDVSQVSFSHRMLLHGVTLLSGLYIRATAFDLKAYYNLDHMQM